jgi:hypothetical protein
VAEYIFETSALADELASNELSSNKSHAAEETLATDTIEQDPEGAYSMLYDGTRDVCAMFRSFDKASCRSTGLGWVRSELRRLQRRTKRINNSPRYLIVFAADHQLLKEDMHMERLQEMAEAMKRRQVPLWTFDVKLWNVAHFSKGY